MRLGRVHITRARPSEFEGLGTHQHRTLLILGSFIFGLEGIYGDLRGRNPWCWLFLGFWAVEIYVDLDGSWAA